MYTYLLLNIGTLLFPLALSFDKKVAFFRSWFALFPAILMMAVFFLIWDEAFTQMGIWGFNPEYLTGIYLFSLPLGEWLFFFTVPYACLFIYACVGAYFPQDPLKSIAPYVFKGLAVTLFILGIVFMDRWYTGVTFILLSLWIVYHVWIQKVEWLGQFLLAYLIVQIPFGLVNGVLTSLPVVWYNDLENLGFRLVSIPIEDTMYNMLMLMMTVSYFEWLLNRRKNAFKSKLTSSQSYV